MWWWATGAQLSATTRPNLRPGNQGAILERAQPVVDWCDLTGSKSDPVLISRLLVWSGPFLSSAHTCTKLLLKTSAGPP